MAKVVITLEDTPNEAVSVDMSFSPVIKKGVAGTPAQWLAMDILRLVKEQSTEDAPEPEEDGSK